MSVLAVSDFLRTLFIILVATPFILLWGAALLDLIRGHHHPAWRRRLDAGDPLIPIIGPMIYFACRKPTQRRGRPRLPGPARARARPHSQPLGGTADRRRDGRPLVAARGRRGRARGARAARRARAGPALQPRRVGAAPGSPGPGRDPRGAVGDAACRTGADPLRADARHAVHVLPRRRGDHGRRPRRRALVGHHHPAGGRRPPVELRRLRGARPPARLRRQRLRRDASRGPGSGTSSASSRASPSPAATAASPPASGAASSSPRRAPTARRCATSPACGRSTSGTRDSTSTDLFARWQAEISKKRLKAAERAAAKARARTA